MIIVFGVSHVKPLLQVPRYKQQGTEREGEDTRGQRVITVPDVTMDYYSSRRDDGLLQFQM